MYVYMCSFACVFVDEWVITGRLYVGYVCILVLGY